MPGHEKLIATGFYPVNLTTWKQLKYSIVFCRYLFDHRHFIWQQKSSARQNVGQKLKIWPERNVFYSFSRTNVRCLAHYSLWTRIYAFLYIDCHRILSILYSDWLSTSRILAHILQQEKTKWRLKVFDAKKLVWRVFAVFISHKHNI